MESRPPRPRPELLLPVAAREPSTQTGELAATLLGEAAGRRLESGELLLVSEEATLADLEAAAAAIPLASALPAPPVGEPLFDQLTAPRLLSPRLWEIFDWQPPLGEHLRMLEGVLRAGMTVAQVMLVGHLETFPERVEHLARLRAVSGAGGVKGGALVVAVRQFADADLAGLLANRTAADGARLRAILVEARPRRRDDDRRQALALARLALGPGAVWTD